MSRAVTDRVMVLVDGIWRLANTVPDSYTPKGDIQAELNGMAIVVLNGHWYNISPGISEEELRASTIQNNVEHLFNLANQKIEHKRRQERRAQQVEQELARAQLLVRAQELIMPRSLPFPAEEQIVLQRKPESPADIPPAPAEENDYLDILDDYDSGGCDCDDCRRNRGEL